MPSAIANILASVDFVFGGHLALALIVGVLMVKHDAEKFKLAADKILDLCFWLLLAAILGSRCTYVLFNPADYLNDPLAVFEFWKGGLSVSGGIVSALIVGLVFTRKRGLRLRPTADVLAPALAIGNFFIWMGCFFSGTCGRLEPDLPGMADNIGRHAGPAAGATSDPMSLFLACGYFVIFVVLIWAARRRAFEGQLICIFVALHGVFRYFSEIVSADPIQLRFWGQHSHSRVIAALLAIWAVGVYLYFWQSNRKKEQSN